MAEHKAAYYEALDSTGKVRVNTAIIEGFKDPQFVEKFRVGVKKPGDRAEHFQQNLDDLRNFLAYNVDKLPQLKPNGMDDRADLGAQQTILREIKGLMADSGPDHPASQITAAASVKTYSLTKKGPNYGKLEDQKEESGHGMAVVPGINYQMVTQKVDLPQFVTPFHANDKMLNAALALHGTKFESGANPPHKPATPQQNQR